jgi:hypothetical protein
MFSWKFWKDAIERGLKTFAQAAIALLGAGMVNVLEVSWTSVLATAAGAAVLSFLTSVAGVDIGPKGTPSLVTDAHAPAVTPPVTPSDANPAATPQPPVPSG